MSAPKFVRTLFNKTQVAIGITLASYTAAFGQMAEQQTPKEKDEGFKDRVKRVFNESE